jgi:CTP:molybdopterin cytidylyltransferase MocA
VSGIPDTWLLIIVGPERALDRPAELAREDPPGGGPGAGLVAGAAAAAAAGATVIATLPGDAPRGGAAAVRLAETLSESADQVVAVIGVDQAGVDQPLQLAVRAPALQRLAAHADNHGISARRLLDDLAAAGEVVRVRLPSAYTTDVDRPEDLTAARSHLT